MVAIDEYDGVRPIVRHRSVPAAGLQFISFKSASTPPPPPPPPPEPQVRSAPVPDVAGRSSAEASYALSDAGFFPRGAFEDSSTVAFGVTTRTDPPAGTVLRLGLPVTYYTSTGRAP
jgi:hypothetical protein